VAELRPKRGCQLSSKVPDQSLWGGGGISSVGSVSDDLDIRFNGPSCERNAGRPPACMLFSAGGWRCPRVVKLLAIRTADAIRPPVSVAALSTAHLSGSISVAESHVTLATWWVTLGRLWAVLALALATGRLGGVWAAETEAATRGFTLTSVGNGAIMLFSPEGSRFSDVLAPFRLTGNLPTERMPVQLVGETTALDLLPPNASLACYLVGIRAGSALPTFLCGAPRVASGSAPGNLTIYFDNSCSEIPIPGTCLQGPETAFLSWNAAPGASDYVFVPVGTSRAQIIAGNITSVADDTRGRFTCYVVVARNGGRVVGFSDVVCGLRFPF
jgi:hypothetical protein